MDSNQMRTSPLSLTMPTHTIDVIEKSKRTKPKHLKPHRQSVDGGRVTTKYCDLPLDLVVFFEDRYIYGDRHKYKHVSPFTSHGKTCGWGAQRHYNGSLMRIGTFDDEDVAGLATAASYLDESLLDVSCGAVTWLNDMNDETKRREWMEFVQTDLPSIPLPMP